MNSLEDEIREVLERILNNIHGITGAAVINIEDGLPIASTIPGDIEDDLIGAMTAVISQSGKEIAKNLLHNPMQQIYIKSQDNYIVLNSINGPEEMMLAIIAPQKVKFGLILFQLRQDIIPNLEQILQQFSPKTR